ncbi:MAG: NlpC/P60 family protein [Enterocloster sp.]|nr:NlpC/P60 family protein [Enterocloster sp.]
MNTWKKLLIISGMCSLAGVTPAFASTNLETGSSLAGISVALNNYYAGNTQPEKKLASSYDQLEATAKNNSSVTKAAAETKAAASAASKTKAETKSQTSSGAKAETKAAAPKETKAAASQTKAASSSYDNIAVSKVSGSVNIRTEANTTSSVTGKIYNDCAATILDTVEGEGGKWYKIQSGSVTGYIKSEYFVTGQKAETKAKEVGKTYGTVVDTTSLRLRESPDLTSKTLTLLSEGAQYSVVGQEGDFLKVSVDTDLEGYVFKDYMKTSVEFNKAVSVEEEKAKEEDEAKRKEEADKAIKELEAAKKAESKAAQTKAETTASKKETVAAKAETTAAPKAEPQKETAKETEAAVKVIAANPEKAEDVTVAAPTVKQETKAETKIETKAETKAETIVEAKTETKPEGPGTKKETSSSKSTESSSVETASRTALIAYAQQFLGNPYVYGGTSLTKGADCSGFVMSVFSHFGISTGRSSRDQAARGKTIPVSEVKPGDLLFYASGSYINHVGIYVGNGKIIHSSTPATGICYAPSNYRTPCKAVTFFD